MLSINILKKTHHEKLLEQKLSTIFLRNIFDYF